MAYAVPPRREQPRGMPGWRWSLAIGSLVGASFVLGALTILCGMACSDPLLVTAGTLVTAMGVLIAAQGFFGSEVTRREPWEAPTDARPGALPVHSEESSGPAPQRNP